MNGLSDVRLKLYGVELERQALCQSLVRAPAGLGCFGLMLHRWKTCRALLDLTPEQLRDIGLTRAQALEEGLKPFWRAA